MKDAEGKEDYVANEFDMITGLLRRLRSEHVGFEERKSIRNQAKVTQNLMLRLGNSEYVHHASWSALFSAVLAILEKTKDVDEYRHHQEMVRWRRR